MGPRIGPALGYIWAYPAYGASAPDIGKPALRVPGTAGFNPADIPTIGALRRARS
jgi:hypothetical protein